MKIRLRGVTVGGLNTSVSIEKFSTSGWEVRTHDTARTGGNGVLPGRDLLGKDTWAFSLAAYRSYSLEEGRAALAELETRWRAPAAPGVLQELDYLLDDSTTWRTVFGRPRKFVVGAPDVHARMGVVKAQCEFDVLDPLSYAAASDVVSASLVVRASRVTRGFMFPARFPLAIMGGVDTGEKSVRIEVPGSAPAPVVVTFYGPCTMPAFKAGNNVLRVAGRIPAGDCVRVDTRTGVVTNKAGGFVPFMVDARDRAFQWRLEPGEHTLTGFAVAGSTDDVRIDVQVLPAFTTI